MSSLITRRKHAHERIFWAGRTDLKAPQVELAVDGNRDGTIEKGETASKEKPFRFWINDDQDVSGLQTSGYGSPYSGNDDEVIPNESGSNIIPNWKDNVINGVRDLEDFARLNIYLGSLSADILSCKYQIGLKWKDVSGKPAVKIWRNLSPGGGSKYLTDLDVAIQHLTLRDPLYVRDSQICIIPKKFWEDSGVAEGNSIGYLLFEGCALGKGQLVVSICGPDGREVFEGSGGVWLDLQNVRSMYERIKVTPIDPKGIPDPYNSKVTFDDNTADRILVDDGNPFLPPPDEEASSSVFVHGSNISYPEARWNADTMYKRLYWKGYKGRFSLFYWNTLVGPWEGEVPAHYNLNEYRAWKYGQVLKKYVESGLPSNYPNNYTRSVIGHSMGNVVVSSALRARPTIDGTVIPGMQAKCVIFMQAAIPASCFDSNARVVGALSNAERHLPTPDHIEQLGYRGVMEGSVGIPLYSMCNEGDYALDKWIYFNQLPFKPEGAVGAPWLRGKAYTWSEKPGGELWAVGSFPFVSVQLFRIRYVKDWMESLAFVARSRTAALGADFNTAGSIKGTFHCGDFGTARPGHSGQFTKSIQFFGDGEGFYDYIFEKVR